MKFWLQHRVSVQGVKSLGGHFACLCRGFEFYEVKKKIVIIFQKENGNSFTLFIIFIVKSLQKEQNSTNLLLWPPICRNKRVITPKWINSYRRLTLVKSQTYLYFIVSSAFEPNNAIPCKAIKEILSAAVKLKSAFRFFTTWVPVP